MNFTHIEVVEWMGQSWIELVRHLYGGDETQCTLEAFAEKGTHVMRLIGTVRIMGAPILSMTSHPPYSTCEIHYPFLIESGDINEKENENEWKRKRRIRGCNSFRKSEYQLSK